jgi:predicted nucleic acid-binding Zn ribbon protein
MSEPSTFCENCGKEILVDDSWNCDKCGKILCLRCVCEECFEDD